MATTVFDKPLDHQVQVTNNRTIPSDYRDPNGDAFEPVASINENYSGGPYIVGQMIFLRIRFVVNTEITKGSTLFSNCPAPLDTTTNVDYFTIKSSSSDDLYTAFIQTSGLIKLFNTKNLPTGTYVITGCYQIA